MLSIEVCPTDRQRDALWLLFSELAPIQRAAQANSTLQSIHDGQIDPTGLLIATDHDQLIGVVLANVMAGRLGTLWLPRVVAQAPASLPMQLIAATDGYFTTCQAAVAMAAVPSDDDNDANTLVTAGYQRLAAILFLTSGRGDFPTTHPKSTLSFRPFTSAEEGRLQRIVAETYQQTMDCPALGGVRRIEDVLTGYRATGSYAEDRWLLVEEEDAEVGCLLLTDHPENDHLELIYMGILPAMRGRGLGVQVIRQAQWQTQLAGREMLVLAVDELNSPAIKLYAEAGFKQVGRQVIFHKSVN